MARRVSFSAPCYNVYGGLQDNQTWYGPSRRSGGIGSKYWEPVTNGDGFWAFPDPTDDDLVYAEIQGGNLFRVRKSTVESRDIKPSPRQGEPAFRFNWNTPIHLSPNSPGVIYYGAQFLFRSSDKGDSWERISPDLTTNDPARQRQHESGGLTLDDSTAENNCTIYAIAESPRNAGVIWVGTDDGNLQVTRDGGRTWTNVVGAVPGLRARTWVSSVEAGHFDERVAYVTFDGHMTGDMRPHVYRTADFGKTWESLAGGDLRGYAHVVREDLVNPDLLFVGTESGLFVSLDRGRGWAQFTSKLPPVAVRDLAIHPREGDLIIATHGRGIYIIDDLTPLRMLTPEILASEAAFLGSRPAQMVMPVMQSPSNGNGEFVGESPAEAAFIAYYLQKRHIFGDLRLEVYDTKGTLIASLAGGKRAGINRVAWPMRASPPRTAPGIAGVPNWFSLLGPRVLEGVYRVKLVRGEQTLESQVRLVPDPRSPHSAEDRELQHKAVLELYSMVERLAGLVTGIEQVRNQARSRAVALPAGDDLRKRLEALAASLEEQRVAIVATRQGEGLSGEEKLREEMSLLYGNVNGYEGRPTDSQRSRMELLRRQIDAAAARFDKTTGAGLEALNRQLVARGMDAIARRGGGGDAR